MPCWLFKKKSITIHGIINIKLRICLWITQIKKSFYSGEKFFEIYDNDIDDNNINEKCNKKLYVNTFFQNQ